MERNAVNLQLAKLMKDAAVEGCFYPDKTNCSETVIRSHSIQNNRTLRRLAENGDVLMVTSDATENRSSLVMTRMGRAKATTFTGFCNHHDKIVFQPIEDKNYAPGNGQQDALFAFRALAKEWHAKLRAYNMSKKLAQEAPANPMVQAALIGQSQALHDIEAYLEVFKEILLNNQSGLLATKHISFGREYLLAVSSTVTLPCDFVGNYFEDLFDPNRRPAPLFVTVFPEDGKTQILLSYFNDHEPVYSFLQRQLIHLPEEEQRIRLTNLIMLNCENVVLSPKLWNKLSEKQRDAFLAAKTTNLFELEGPDSFIKNRGFTLFE